MPPGLLPRSVNCLVPELIPSNLVLIIVYPGNGEGRGTDMNAGRGIAVVAAVLMALAAACGGGEGEETAEEPGSQVAEQTVADRQEELVDVGNTLCPVMGGRVAQGQSFQWEGYSIGICCPGCGDTFKSDPQHYLPALLEDPGLSDEVRAGLSEHLQGPEAEPGGN